MQLNCSENDMFKNNCTTSALIYNHCMFGILECGEGYFGNAETCNLCPIGTYSDTDNVDVCTSCPEGLTTFQPGSTQCCKNLSLLFIFVHFDINHNDGVI